MVQQYITYVYIVILIIAIVGNSLNILVFTNLKLFHRNQCAFYLCIESIINTTALLHSSIDHFTQYPDGHDLADYSLIWCKTRFILEQILQISSFSIMCFITFDQILCTSYSYTIRQMSTYKLAQYLICIALCCAIGHSIPSIFFSSILPPMGCASDNKIFIYYYLMFYYPILIGFLPLFLSILFSLIAFRNVRHLIRRQIPLVRRKLDRQLTAMVFVRVIIFVILYLPYVVYRTFTLVKIVSDNYDIPFLFDLLMQTSVIFLKDLNYTVRRFFRIFLIYRI